MPSLVPIGSLDISPWVIVTETCCYLKLTNVQDSPPYFEMFSQMWGMAATTHKSKKKMNFWESLKRHMEFSRHKFTHTSTEGLLIKVWAQWQAHLLPRVSAESRISSTHTSSVSWSPAAVPSHPTPACHRYYQSKTKHWVPWQRSITGPMSCDSPLLFLVFHCVLVEKVCQSHRTGWFIGHCLIRQL